MHQHADVNSVTGEQGNVPEPELSRVFYCPNCLVLRAKHVEISCMVRECDFRAYMSAISAPEFVNGLWKTDEIQRREMRMVKRNTDHDANAPPNRRNISSEAVLGASALPT